MIIAIDIANKSYKYFDALQEISFWGIDAKPENVKCVVCGKKWNKKKEHEWNYAYMENNEKILKSPLCLEHLTAKYDVLLKTSIDIDTGLIHGWEVIFGKIVMLENRSKTING